MPVIFIERKPQVKKDKHPRIEQGSIKRKKDQTQAVSSETRRTLDELMAVVPVRVEGDIDPYVMLRQMLGK